MSFKITGIALVIAAATAAAPSAASARHWSEINGSFQTAWPAEQIHAWDHEPFRAVVRDLQRYIPAHVDAYAGLHQMLGIHPNGLFMRLEAVSSAFTAVGPFQWGGPGMSLTAEPRVDRQGDGTLAASASIWQHLPWTGWVRVWEAGPTPSLTHREEEGVTFINERVGYQLNVLGMATVHVNAIVLGSHIARANFTVDAGGAFGHVEARPSVAVVADGYSGPTGSVVAYVHGTGADTHIAASGHVGYVTPQLKACGKVWGNMHLGGIGKAFVWTSRTNSRVLDQPGYFWWGPGFWREHCHPLR
jgi:hypothetical protein